MKRKTLGLLITVVAFVLVLGGSYFAYDKLKEKQQQVSYTPQPAEQQEPRMPDIPLFTLEDEPTSFDAVRQGKPTVINYFASWCPPCKEELPHFEEAYHAYKDRISFIFLDSLDGQRETKETIARFIEEFPFSGPVYYDEGLFAYLFQTNSLPTTVFFRADGTVAGGYLGYVSEQTLLTNLEQLLK